MCRDESALLQAVIAAIVGLDPDIIVGFDVMKWSLGYLDARSHALDFAPPLIRRIGRCPKHPGTTKTFLS